MTWNADKAQKYFVSKRGNPENIKFKQPQNDFLRGLYDIALAQFDLYDNCSSSAYSKTYLLSILENIIIDKIIPNKNCNSDEKCISSYYNQSKQILADFEIREIKF